MTNAGGDHFDAYDGVEDYQQAFAEFLQKLPEKGQIVTHMSDTDCSRLASQSGRGVIDADVSVLPELQVPGRHMQENAQLALVAAMDYGVPEQSARAALAEFTGTWRRCEVKGVLQDDIVLIDDYGHHPREVVATLGALKEAYPDRRLVCAFQPHMHDRTLQLYDDFLSAFTAVDQLLIPYVYDARNDVENEEVDVKALVADIANTSATKVQWTHSLERTENVLRTEVLQPGDVLVCMGAGDITDLAESLLLNLG